MRRKILIAAGCLVALLVVGAWAGIGSRACRLGGDRPAPAGDERSSALGNATPPTHPEPDPSRSAAGEEGRRSRPAPPPRPAVSRAGDLEVGPGVAPPTGTAARPRTLGEAIALSPGLEADLAARDPQKRFNLDYKLGLIGRLDDCLGPAVRSQGTVFLVLHFGNDPATGSGVGVDFDVRDSQLDEAEDRLFLACLGEAHRGFAIATGETFGQGPDFYMPIGITIPTSDDQVYRAVATGAYDAE